ncbi:sensor histidine kinase [Cohnella rhizosphaerae]|uniref:ATP-binding protein n=1 Tax=Cohnella rhizosphaerae TaxID=1457232 RepID=A0A9X4QU41_9BACL|nr:ATP-binding protein [Cohnella rhizosphaerae]MDG0811345.1 ATP-binding protein [Cohnella rhizosphaerae]
MSESGAADETRRLIISLSRLFKLGLNQGLEMTTLGLELEHVEHYLRIQQASYEGLFDYEIRRSFDASLLGMPMLKILLQPLVENSILHGFKDFTDGGRILIEVEDEGGTLRVAVTDNGAGMDAEEATRTIAQEPQESEAIDAGRKGYALRNVYRRILLHYGERAEFRLESEPFAQTRITILLPLPEGNEK